MTKFSSPVPVGCRFTSGFRTKGRPNHAGSDWAPPVPGQTGVPLFAIADGVVRSRGTNILTAHTGLAVLIDHDKLTDKYGTDHMQTYQGHMSRIDVKVGDKVTAGQQIGIMGATGNVTGIHVHVGVLCNGKFIDPRAWLSRKGITPGVTPPVSGVRYKVVAGDSLSKIGAKFGVNWRDIAKRNNLKPPYTIYPGNTLVTR